MSTALHALLLAARAGRSTTDAAMPAKLDTSVDGPGVRLSGGEHQRIALARATLRAPGLLILNEATNAIDIASERAIVSSHHER